MVGVLRAILAGMMLSLSLISPVLAQGHDEERPGTLEPTYEPRPPPEPQVYTGQYLFSLTRGVSDSTLHPAAKAPMYLFTVPLDIVFLPFTAIAGFFPPTP